MYVKLTQEGGVDVGRWCIQYRGEGDPQRLYQKQMLPKWQGQIEPGAGEPGGARAGEGEQGGARADEGG